MACVLVNPTGLSKMLAEPVYNFTSLRVACRTALALMLGQKVYKDMPQSAVNAQSLEIWTKDRMKLDRQELIIWYQRGYDEYVKTRNASKHGIYLHNRNLYNPPKAKQLGLKYKDYQYQIFWAAWKDAYYDHNTNNSNRKLV